MEAVTTNDLDISTFWIRHNNEVFNDVIFNERIYMIAIEQVNDQIYWIGDREIDGNEITPSYMCLIVDDNNDEHGNIVIYGRDSRAYFGEWGTQKQYITFDYTNYIKRKIAACRIQATWRKYRRIAAAKVIQICFRQWKFNMEYRWNPHTFFGIVNMLLDYNRTLRE